MCFSWRANKFILGLCFCCYFSLWSNGAAIATGISQVASCTMLLLYITLKAKYIKFKKLSKINFEKIFKILEQDFQSF